MAVSPPTSAQSRLHAAVADALDEVARQGRVVLGHGDVVEEHQRLAARAEAVVDRHGHEVDADRVVLAGQRGDFELAADAVGAGDEDRMAVVAGEEAGIVIEAKQTGKAAETVQDARRVRPAQERRHARQGLFVQIEVEAGGPVGQGRLVHQRTLRGASASGRRHPADASRVGDSILCQPADAGRSPTRRHRSAGGVSPSETGRIGAVSRVPGGSGCCNAANNFAARSGCWSRNHAIAA